MSRVLVTGGSGFIGRHLVERLIVDGFDVGVLDTLGESSENSSGREGNPRFHRGDITDSEFVNRLVRDYEIILHEAAVVATGATDIASMHSTNVDGTINLLAAATKSNNNGFVYASSAAVYGEVNDGLVREDYSPNPVSPYGFSKLEGEKYCRFFGTTYGLRTVCLRYFNVYGPRQRSGPYGGAIPVFLQRIANGVPPIIFGNGNQIRDFVHINDVVEANVLAMRANRPAGDVFNISTGVPTSVNRLAIRLCELAGRPETRPLHVAERTGDVKYSCGDFRKAEEFLGYRPRVRLDEGLKDLVSSARVLERESLVAHQV